MQQMDDVPWPAQVQSGSAGTTPVHVAAGKYLDYSNTHCSLQPERVPTDTGCPEASTRHSRSGRYRRWPVIAPCAPSQSFRFPV